MDQLDLNELGEEVRLYIAEAQAARRNQNISGQLAEDAPKKMSLEVTKETQLKAQVVQNTTLQRDKEKLDQAEHTRTAELRALQATFNALCAQGMGTVEALKQVAKQTKILETQWHLNALLNRASMLQLALPEKSETVTRLLNRTGIDLGATTVSGSFAAFMSVTEAEETLNDAECTLLRRIITQGDHHLKTGTQVRRSALQTLTDPETGKALPLHSPDNKLEIRPGVYAFTETGHDVMLELREGALHQAIDVTGLDGASIGIVSEIFTLAALAHDLGAGGFLKHIYGVDVERFATQGFDPLTLNALSRKLTYLMGTGHDGEIFSPEHQAKLLETQIRLVSPTGELLPWNDDSNGYAARVKELGLDKDTNLKEFGRYTRLNYHTGINRKNLEKQLFKFTDKFNS